MKNISLLLTIFTLTLSCVFGQQQQHSLSKAHDELLRSLKKEVDQTWIKPNPSLERTKPSFFNQANVQDYYIGLLQISGESIPFTWDNDISLLAYLLRKDSKVNLQQGAAADQYLKGTKLTWQRPVDGLVWFNNNSYKASVANWHLVGVSDCPGTITFPTLFFKKVVEVPDARTNSLTGLAILPYNALFKIESAELDLVTTAGHILQGTGYDLDADGIYDVFSYSEELDEITSYNRLYINVAGEWKCTWINYSEDCI